MSSSGSPLALFIIGPPAVGKMTVGAVIAQRTGLRLFHNHQTIDLVLPFFPFGSKPFRRLVDQFRTGIFEEVAQSNLPGLIFTYVWAFDQLQDAAFVEGLADIFRSRGGRVLFVELQAGLDERLSRNESEFRLAQKPGKRDVVASRKRLLDVEGKHQLNSRDYFAGRSDYLFIDNTRLTPDVAATQVIGAFDLLPAALA
jgi:hypothetical protein